jgi:hypothetical protein
MTSTADAITNKFPHLILDKSGDNNTEPTFAAIQHMQVQLNVKSIYMQSNRDDGQNGLLSLTIIDVEYAAHSAGNLDFVAPANPTPQPVHVARATVAQITETNFIHAEYRAVFQQ